MKNYHYILANLVSPSVHRQQRAGTALAAGRKLTCARVCCCKGFMDLNMTEFQKLGPNVTGFELINRSDPAVVKINQDWLDFDSKDLKLARRSLRVSGHQPHTNQHLVPHDVSRLDVDTLCYSF